MARVIAVTNQKGGVGKSTTALNLGAALVEGGSRVILVDLDPHAGLTFSLGYENPEQFFTKTAYDLLDPDNPLPLQDVAVETKIPRLDFVPSHQDLVEIDYRLVGRPGWANTLKRRIREAEGQYEYVIIDCPPSLGILTRMALVAAELALVPVQSEWLALRGLKLLNRVVQQIRTEADHDGLQVKYLVTMHGRTKHAEEIEAEIRQHLSGQVYETVVRRSVRFPDSTLAGQPLLLFDTDHQGAQAYRQLAKEISIYEHSTPVSANQG